MGRRILFIAAAVLVIVAAVFLSSPGNTGDYSRILVMKMHLADGKVSGNTAEVKYGHAPDPQGRSGPFKGTLLTRERKVVREFSVWDPSLQLGDAADTSTNGTEELFSMAVMSRENDLVLILPFQGEETQFTLIDTRTGRSLTSLDLTPAREQFAQTYPGDPSLKRDEQAVFFMQNGPAGMLAVGAFLIILLMVIVIFMTRQERR